MRATAIADIKGRQILDSRGRPTIEAEVRLQGGAWGRAAVPAGASRGAAEAHELRDNDPTQFQGRGVRQAVARVNGPIRAALLGQDGDDQAAIDATLAALDGTPNFARLGGNAVLGVSLATLRAAAGAASEALHRRIARLAGCAPPTMPLPMVNILSGGLHAGRGMDVQDFLVMPVGAESYGQALDWICRVRLSAAELMEQDGLTTLLADEGGLSPGFAHSHTALELMVRAFEAAGLRPGADVAIALDIAASSLGQANGRYQFPRAGASYDAAEMTALLAGWVAEFPIVSIEDGLGEEDWAGWPGLTARLGDIQLVGDDLFATQPARIARGVKAGVANSVLIKINQNGSFSGTLEAMRTARAAGYACVVSARSGETEDDFIADLAVGTGAGQIKIGSVRNSERLAKYNQLLRIEEEGFPFAGASALGGRRG
jgi:enolase